MCADIGGKALGRAAAALLALAVSSPVFVGTPREAAGETRSLKLYFIHTGEKAVITFKRNGRFDPKGLQQLNRFLRDWRSNQPTKMDPRLFDLVWEVYRQSGSQRLYPRRLRLSARRRPTACCAAARASGVAEKSQHMLGKAMDFFIPDVKLADAARDRHENAGRRRRLLSDVRLALRAHGRRRRSRLAAHEPQELVRLFPDGNTMHMPADGKPLPGYQQAVADYKRRVQQPQIQIASGRRRRYGDARSTKTLFAALFGGGADEEEDEPVTIPLRSPLPRRRRRRPRRLLRRG